MSASQEQGTWSRSHSDDSTADGAAAEAAGSSKTKAGEAKKAGGTQINMREVDSAGSNGEQVQDPFLVTFASDDPENPRNWSNRKRYAIVIFVSWLNILVAGMASAYSVGSKGIVATFGVSEELATGGEVLYILSLAWGPMLVAPLSELIGRKPVYLYAWGFLVAMHFLIGFAPNFPALAIGRFLAGVGASPPLSNTGGVVSDLFARDESGYAYAVYVYGSTIGPAFAGNVVYSFVAQQKGWRWIFWIAIIILGFHFFLILFFLPETRHNIILDRRVRKLRKEHNDDRYRSAHHNEEDEHASTGKSATAWERLRASRWTIALTRPVRFLFTEPITMFAALWNGLLYGLIFLFNTAFGEVFGPGNGGYGWTTPGLVQLTFLCVVIGCTIGAALYPVIQEPYYQRRIRREGGSVPEARMFFGTIGSILIPIGLFMFAWTCFPSISFIVPLIGGAIFSIGFFAVLFGVLAYLIDSYGQYSASALAAAILIRNLFGAAFPLFSAYMYRRLNNHWATTLIACLALPLVPLQFLFFWKGEALRRRSPWASTHFNEDEDSPH